MDRGKGWAQRPAMESLGVPGQLLLCPVRGSGLGESTGAPTGACAGKGASVLRASAPGGDTQKWEHGRQWALLQGAAETRVTRGKLKTVLCERL